MTIYLPYGYQDARAVPYSEVVVLHPHVVVFTKTDIVHQRLDGVDLVVLNREVGQIDQRGEWGDIDDQVFVQI